MSIQSVALDACVLRDLEIGDDEDVLTNVDVISDLRDRGLPLAVDFEHHILNEYFRVLQPNSLGRRFLTSCIRRSVILYTAGKLAHKHMEALNRHRFDPNDIPYLAVARETEGLYVTSEEKHLRPNRRQFVLETCGVEIVTLHELGEIIGR